MEILIGVAFPALVATLAVRVILYLLAIALGLSATTRKSILEGALYGSLAGIILGPIGIIVLMLTLHSLYGTTFLGLEVLAGPTAGAIVCAIPGAVAGAIRGIRLARRANTDVEAA